MSAPVILHATCVSWGGRAALIVGASGTGKSALALTLMAHGCCLVADDRVRLEARDRAIYAACPDAIQGLIEARGIGILQASRDTEAKVRIDAPHFTPAILQILKAGWSDR